MMKTQSSFLLLIILFLCSTFQLQAQKPTQVIEGRVIDKETKNPLAAVIIFVEDTYPVISTTSDLDGYFRLDEIPTGRHTLKAQKTDYITYFTDNLFIRSAKEVYQEIEMRKVPGGSSNSNITTDYRENVPLNEFSLVSTRSFTVEETQRYAGAIFDPGRMAAAFPGVQAYQDNEADISVRGNSQSGVLYRLEGLDIPVISHFNRPISSGGAISILSIQVLNDSDFSTGAFAAEYGNASSAVFDMHFRKGNKNNREYTAKLGLFGLDFATEGPFKKGNSSYLLNYRYSTLGILSNLGFFVVRDNVSNTFQDLSLNLTFDSDNSKNQFNIFGIGALSNEQWFVRDSAKWVSNLDFQRIDNRCGTAALGFNYIRLLDEKSYLKVLLGGTASSIILNKNNAYLDSARIETNEYLRLDYTLSGTYSRKFNNWFRIKTGLSARANMSDLSYENYNFETNSLDTLIHTNGFAWMLWGQGYLQTNFSISKMSSRYYFCRRYLPGHIYNL